MTIPKEITWPIDPHTKAKHEILRRYLEAWFPILNKYHSRLVYIDGFCGPGRYEGGELGSPIIALRTAIDHTRKMQGKLIFRFTDRDEQRVEHLRNELNKLENQMPSNFDVRVNCCEFADKLEEILFYVEKQNIELPPTFAFIDPFGFSGIPFDLIKRLLSHRSCEVLITLMVDAINRFVEHPRDRLTRHIVEAFGTEESICIAEKVDKEGKDRITELRMLYQKQLNQVAAFVRYFEMRDCDNKTIYYLFFATNHRRGHLKMKEAMWKVDPGGDFVYSDATDPNQRTLFKDECIVPDLSAILEGKFKGQKNVKGEIIRLFVEDDTAFLNKHKKTVLEKMESLHKIEVCPEKLLGGKRAPNTYPDKALITFF